MNTGRRDLVRMLGTGALAFPFLRALPARAAGAPGPRRFVVMQTSNGTIRNEYLPDGGETGFQFRRILAPLEKHRDHLIVVDGLDMKSFYMGPRAAHGGLLHQLVGKSAIDNTKEGKRTNYTAGGPSLDQVIAQHIQGEAPIRSLELGVRCTGTGNYQTCSYKGPNQPNPVVDDPRAVYARLFGTVGSPDADRRARVRSSVIDLVHKEMGALRTRMGTAERRQLDADLSSLKEIEASFRGIAASGGGCATPAAPAPVDHMRSTNVPAVGRLQMDLLVAALRCDLTRVATFMWYDTNGGDELLDFLGMTRTHHDLAHASDAPGNPTGEALVTINRWYSEQLSYFLDRLRAIPEGNGTMLDSTVVLFCNSLGNGKLHRVENVPYVIAGSGGGYFRTGRFLKFGGRAHNDLLISLAQCFGLEMDRFGDPALCTGPLTTLRG